MQTWNSSCSALNEETAARLAALGAELEDRRSSLVSEWALLEQKQQACQEQDAACKVLHSNEHITLMALAKPFTNSLSFSVLAH